METTSVHIVPHRRFVHPLRMTAGVIRTTTIDTTIIWATRTLIFVARHFTSTYPGGFKPWVFWGK